MSPGDIVDAAIAYVQPQVHAHVMQLQVDEAHECHLDPRLVSIALSHLLENAARYSPAGSAIGLAAQASEAGLSISVTDAGSGLDATELERVFEPFYRVEASRNRETGGTGLGLPIARDIVRAHGGDVTLANRPEGGLLARATVPAG